MHPIIKEYCGLVRFLEKVLNDNMEIVLHDLTNMDASVVAIANGHVSGRSIGSPMNENGLRLIRSKYHETEDMYIRYRGSSKKKSKLLSSTKFIKDETGTLIGMFCINYDFERDQAALDNLASALGIFNVPDVGSNEIFKADSEKFPTSMEEVVTSILANTISQVQIPVERLSQEEKVKIVEKLEEKGVFLFKGAVSEVAKGLQTSEATIYRYLSKLSKNNEWKDTGK